MAIILDNVSGTGSVDFIAPTATLSVFVRATTYGTVNLQTSTTNAAITPIDSELGALTENTDIDVTNFGIGQKLTIAYADVAGLYVEVL